MAMLHAVGYCCSIWLVISMFRLVGYGYVLFGWLLLYFISWLLQCSISWLFQCSILLVIAMFCLVGYCYARIPKCLNF